MVLVYDNQYGDNAIFLGDRVLVTEDGFDYYEPAAWARYLIKEVDDGFLLVFSYDFDMNGKWETRTVHLKHSETTISYRKHF